MKTKFHIGLIVGIASIFFANPIFAQSKAPNLGASGTPIISAAYVGGSGTTIDLRFQDGANNGATITAIQSGNDTQFITGGSTTVAGNFTLTFNGQTTTPIAYTTSAPLISTSWNFPTVAGHSYKLGWSWPPITGPSQILLEVINADGSIGATATGSQANSITPAATSGAFADSSAPAYRWVPIADNYAATGTTTTIRMTAGLNTTGTTITWAADSVIVQDKTATTSTIYPASDSTHFATNGSGWTVNSGANGRFSTPVYTNLSSSGVGGLFQCSPTDVQNALDALSNIGANNISASAGTGNALPLSITFVGNMRGATQNAIISNTSSIVVDPTTHQVGGNYPSIAINGGSPILIKDWAPNRASVLGVLRQATPVPLTLKAMTPGIVITTNGSVAANFPLVIPASPATSASGVVYQGATANAVISYPAQELTPGTYQVAVTWPSGWTLSTATTFTVTSATGVLFGTYTVNQTVAPSDYTDTATGIGYKILGSFPVGIDDIGLSVNVTTVGSTNPISMDAAQFVRTTNDTSTIIQTTDTVTFSAPAGFFTTSVGPLGVISNQAVMARPTSGSILPTFNQTANKTMKVGENAEPSSYFGQGLIYSNMAMRFPLHQGLQQDPNTGLPTVIQGQTLNNLIFSEQVFAPNSVLPSGSPKLSLGAPNGRYVLIWDGSCDMTITTSDGSVTEVLQYQNLTHTTNNVRVYDVSMPQAIAFQPHLFANFKSTTPNPNQAGTYLLDATNIRVYPPDPADITGQTMWGLNTDKTLATPPPKWYPPYLYKLQGMKCIRFLDALQGNSPGAYQDFSDLMPLTYQSRQGTTRIVYNVPISRIEAYTGPIAVPGYIIPILVTTTNPHGLTTGTQAKIFGGGTATFSDMTSVNLDFATNNPAYGLIQVLTPTTFLMYYQQSHPSGTTMTNLLQQGTLGSSTFLAGIGTFQPISEIVDLCNQVGADLWWNMSIAATDDCINSIADYIAANLNAGLKLHCEYSNECWNSGFDQYHYLYFQQFAFDGSNGNVEAYVRNTWHVHNLMAARFAAAGRPNDFVRTYASQQANPAVTTSIVAYASQIGAPIDEIAVAPYVENTKTWPTNIHTTRDQALDAFEQEIQVHGNYVKQHLLNLNISYPTGKLVCYEGGIENVLPDSNVPNGNISHPPYWNSTAVNRANGNMWNRNYAVRRHPRIFGINLNLLQQFNDEGCTLYNHFHLMQVDESYSWGSYEWDRQLRGTGDPTIDTINIATPLKMGDPNPANAVVSEIGAANYLFSTLYMNSSPPAPTLNPIPGPAVRPKTEGGLRRRNSIRIPQSMTTPPDSSPLKIRKKAA